MRGVKPRDPWNCERLLTSLGFYVTEGKSGDAWDRLSQVYGWFTEGFEMPDLIAARTLLREVEHAG